ncbi:hypothetical protein [Luteibacter sp. SG786]|uniref:hypothetical protein n=1 Tax=Luteibacter sp. SG786 TaxID=2587130 RepID=UPI00141FDBB2|nr:hypothetical protein [Luteibacter sp. SG786]NII55324.1 hypothetical protein [Luteibacter sp. SG786]
MSKAHVICALLPVLVVSSGLPFYTSTSPTQGDNQLEGMCRTLARRVGEEIHDGVLLLDRLGLGWIVGAED